MFHEKLNEQWTFVRTKVPIKSNKLLIYRKMMSLLKSPCHKPFPYWNSWILYKTQMKKRSSSKPFNPHWNSAQPILCDKHFSISFSDNLEHGFVWKVQALFEVTKKNWNRKFFDLIEGISGTLSTTWCSHY